ncbi:MAG: SprB repeat-containing protein, partial [Bacteroidota bacterium]
CTVTGTPITIEAPSAPSIINVALTNATDCGTEDGTIIITAEGDGNLLYSIGGLFFDTNEFTGLPAGQYTPAVQNQDGSCTVTGTPITIEAPSAPSIINVAFTNATDCGEEDGTITITAEGDGNLLYSIGGLFFDTNEFTGLPAGQYTPAVQNQDGSCTVTGTPITISSPQEPILEAINSSDEVTCGLQDGFIEMLITNESNDLLYSISGSSGPWQAEQIFENLGAGLYDLWVRTENGNCLEDFGQISIQDGPEPSISDVNTAASESCETATGSILIIPSDDVPDYEYSIDDNLWQTDNVFENLPAGTYSPIMRTGEGGCEDIYPVDVVVTAPGAPSIVSSIVAMPSSCDANDGSIFINAQSADGEGLEYSIDGGSSWSTDPQFSDLAIGTFTLTVRTIDQSCTVDYAQEIVLSSPDQPQILDVSTTSATSCEQNDAIITIEAIGTELLEYSIDQGESWQLGPVFSGLAPGAYQVVVRNTGGGCQVEANGILLDGPDLPLAQINNTATSTDCVNPNGLIELSGFGGEGTYEFRLNDSEWQADSVFNGLAPGTYQVSVRNADGSCENLVEIVELGGEDQLILLDPIVVAPDFCNPDQGFLRILVEYTNLDLLEYSIDGGETWSSTGVYPNLPEGIYEIQVRTTTGECLISSNEEIDFSVEALPPVELLDLETSLPASCATADGEITLTATGGAGNYEYSIDGGQSWQTENVFANLSAGNFDILVRDLDNDCLISTSSSLGLYPEGTPEINQIDIEPISSCDASDGSIIISVDMPPNSILYSIDGGQSWTEGNTFENLLPGEYDVSILVAGTGCQIDATEAVALDNPSFVELSAISTTDATNCSDPDGTISFNLVDPEVDFEVSLDGVNWFSTTELTGLPAGTYNLSFRTLAGGCAFSWPEEVELGGPQLPEVLGLEISDANDCTIANGSALVLADPNNGYVYSIDGGATTNSSGSFNNLLPSAYDLWISDPQTGCTNVIENAFELGGFGPFGIEDWTSAGQSCTGEADAFAAVQVMGGTAPYSYNWSNGAQTDSIGGLVGGTYSVFVADAGGCQDSLSIELAGVPTLADWDIALQDTVICGGSSLLLSADLPELADFYWQDVDGTIYSDTSLRVEQSGTVSFYALTLDGCELTDEFELTVQEGDFRSDFLLPAQGVINEPIVAVDISWPVPTVIRWVYDQSQIETIASFETQEIMAFPNAGSYTIGLEATIGECTAYLEKTIEIFDSQDSLDIIIPQPTFTLIESFDLFPNPNDGNFSVRILLNEERPIEFWIFSDQGENISYRQEGARDYHLLSYDNQNLPPAVYTAILRVGDEWEYFNFIVNR